MKKVRKKIKKTSKFSHSLVPASDHGAHGEAHALVVVDSVGEDLGGGCDRDALLVFQLVQGALPAQLALPKRTICSSSSHGPEQVRVDFNDLLHIL